MPINNHIRIEDLQQRNNLYYKKNSDEPYNGPLNANPYNQFANTADVFTHKGSITDGLFSGTISSTSNSKPYEKNLETIIKDGKKNGLDSQWFRDGSRKSETNYSDDEKHGLERYWNSDGQIENECNYSAGQKHGLETRWYENGQKESEINYVNGKKEGLTTMWYRNGQKKSEGNYKDGKEDGTHTHWHVNGQKYEEVNYKDGKEDGTHTLWHDNGQKYESTSHNKDGQELTTKKWNSEGELYHTDTKQYFEGHAVIRDITWVMPSDDGFNTDNINKEFSISQYGLDNLRNLIDEKKLSVNITDFSPSALNQFINFFRDETAIDYIKQVINEHGSSTIVSAYDEEKHKEFISQIDARYPNS